ncbi:peroxisomal assembly protein [Entomortierella chlamydospora]|uniref:Peroxisomal ATPase PEX6 n=1 Tax=Entomortierella chlamydospora TaxID=101097 RepID=A0A9P6N4G5_9FUNG|nr:peroxisomal assembly protein [Entomortierella chlamydospora]KAG0023276.1 peroxisomal assembly protein [Entomortierella chlamydospora]
MSPTVDIPSNRNNNAYASVQAKLSVRPEESVSRESNATTLYRLNNTIQVTKPVWSQLCGANTPIDVHASVPVAIVISQDNFQMHTAVSHNARPLLNAIVTRAVLLTSSIDGHVPESAESECFITSEFARTYMPSSTFENQVQITIQKTDLVVLDEVILAATTTEAYETISADPSLILNHFLPPGGDPVILRYEQVYNIQGPSGEPLPVKVLMCNSVLQGIMEEETGIIFTDMAGQALDQPTGVDFFGSAIPNRHLNIFEDEADPFGFDGDFIASRFLVKDHHPNSKSKSAFKDLHFSVADLEDDDDEDEEEEEDNNSFSDVVEDSGDEIDGRKIRREVNGHGRRITSLSSQTKPVEEKEVPVKRTSLDFSPWVQKGHYPSHNLSPQPAPEDDPEARIFVDVSQLGKLRVFSGDWVLVSAKEPKATQRFCRIYGLTFPTNDTTKGLPRVYLPAGLHFNLGAPSSLTIDAAHLKQDEPTVARAVTVARVASPPTVDKALQSACLEALKEWFEEYERVVCEGDVIGVEIDEEAAKLIPKQLNPADASDIDVRLPLTPSDLKTTIYFKLTHLEDSSKPNKHTQLVDPSVTKMIQSGLEHSRVPPKLKRFGRSPAIPALDDPSAPEAFSQLYQLVSSGLHPFSSKLGLNCTVLLHGARGIGKKTVVDWVADLAGIHLMEVNCFDIASDTDAKTEVAVRAKFDKAVACGPCVLLLRHIDALARKSVALETGQEPILSTVLKDCFTQLGDAFKTMGHPVTVIATTGDIDKVPTSVLGCFLHEIGFNAPNEAQRLAILKNLTVTTPLGPDVSLNALATQTAALVAKDLVDLTGRAGLVAIDRVEKSIEEWNKGHVSAQSLVHAGVTVTAADFDTALNKARASYSDSIGAPKIPNVTWDDVGGLASVKNDILDTIQLPLEHPELFASGLKKRSGILLYGPPGTGKTLLAKAVATSCSLNFFSVKGPELLNMYIGESEANVRRVFQRARDAKPCVIFFDELDSVAPKRGEKGDSGGVMDRIVSQLLAELDGMNGGEGSGDVFVIGATNRPDLLDPALLRPGRFDKLLYLSVSTKHEEQLRIIQALTRKFRLHPSLDLANVAEKCPFNYTGADFYALCTDAMLKAMSRTADGIENRVVAINNDETSTLPRPITSQYYLDHLAQPDEILVQVTEEDFDQALAELIPSVSAQELEHYRQVQKMFNSDDFAKDMEAAAAAAEEEREKKNKAGKQKQVNRENDDWELTEASRKVEEAQRLLSAERENAEVSPSSPSKSKGKGRSSDYSHVEQHVERQHQLGVVIRDGEKGDIGLEEPIMVSEEDQVVIQETIDHQGNGGSVKETKKRSKGKGRK